LTLQEQEARVKTNKTAHSTQRTAAGGTQIFTKVSFTFKIPWGFRKDAYMLFY